MYNREIPNRKQSENCKKQGGFEYCSLSAKTELTDILKSDSSLPTENIQEANKTLLNDKN